MTESDTVNVAGLVPGPARVSNLWTVEPQHPNRRPTILIRVLAVLAAWNAVLWIVVGLLVAPLLPGGWGTIAAVAVVLLLPLVVLARGFLGHGYPSAATRIWIYRPFWYGQLFLPFLAIAGVVGTVVGLPFGAPGTGGRMAMAGMAGVLTCSAILGYAGTRRLAVRPLDLAIAGLPAGLDGLRIVQLSDLHVGPHTPRRHLERVVRAVEAAEPELLVLTGDQVDDYARDTEPLATALGGLSAPLGVFAVAGNHDVYAGWSEVRVGMERIGWRVLLNEAVPLERKDARFWLGGTGDPAGRSPMADSAEAAPDLDRTLDRVPDGEIAIVLAHNPALWPGLARRGVALTLSGHTHYGQFSIPRLGWSLASAFLEHAMGVHRDGQSVLYINPGTNYWGVPIRIGTPPEVTVVTLRRAASAIDGGAKVVGAAGAAR